jgi:hypothetical protein
MPALGAEAAEKMNAAVTSTPVVVKKWGQNRLNPYRDFDNCRFCSENLEPGGNRA